MKILTVGLGSIGRRHLRNLRDIVPEAAIAVWRQRGLVDDPSIGRVIASEEEALAFAPDVAIIATPAALHVPNALSLARRGTHLLIEKPLADSLAGVDELLQTCERQGAVLMVGYNLRFYEPLRRVREAIRCGAIGRVLSVRAEVGQYLPDWRPDQDYRQTASARRNLGGGAVLELSHELDYVRWLLGDFRTVLAMTRRLSDLEIDVEDTAEIIVEFVSGALGSIRMDMVQRVGTRSCRVVGAEGTIEWNLQGHRARLYRSVEGQWSDLHPALEIDMNDTYVGELDHFLTCVATGTEPAVSASDGRRVLEIVEAVKQSAATHRSVEL